MDQRPNAHLKQKQAILPVLNIRPHLREDNVPCEIEHGLFLGSFEAAINKDALKSRSITHILTVANSLLPAHPNDFVYKVIGVADKKDTNLYRYFDECINFIDEAKRLGGGVLVHCFVGKSRSVTIVIAYMMRKRGMRLPKAMKYVKSRRPQAAPNSGFISQLRDFEISLQATIPAVFSDPKDGPFPRNQEEIWESFEDPEVEDPEIEDPEPDKKKTKQSSNAAEGSKPQNFDVLPRSWFKKFEPKLATTSEKRNAMKTLANESKDIIPVDKLFHSSWRSRSVSQLGRSFSPPAHSPFAMVSHNASSFAFADRSEIETKIETSPAKLVPSSAMKLTSSNYASFETSAEAELYAEEVTLRDTRVLEDIFRDAENFFRGLDVVITSPVSLSLPSISSEHVISSPRGLSEQEFFEAVAKIRLVLPQLAEGNLEYEVAKAAESAIELLISQHPKHGLSGDLAYLLMKIGQRLKELPSQITSFRAAKDKYSINQALIAGSKEMIRAGKCKIDSKKKDKIGLDAELHAVEDDVRCLKALLLKAQEKKAIVEQKIEYLKQEVKAELSSCKSAKEVVDKELKVSRELESAKEKAEREEMDLMKSVGNEVAEAEKFLNHLTFF